MPRPESVAWDIGRSSRVKEDASSTSAQGRGSEAIQGPFSLPAHWKRNGRRKDKEGCSRRRIAGGTMQEDISDREPAPLMLQGRGAPAQEEVD